MSSGREVPSSYENLCKKPRTTWRTYQSIWPSVLTVEGSIYAVKKILLIEISGNIKFKKKCINVVLHLFTIIKIFIWFQWCVALYRNETTLSPSNYLFHRHIKEFGCLIWIKDKQLVAIFKKIGVYLWILLKFEFSEKYLQTELLQIVLLWWNVSQTSNNFQQYLVSILVDRPNKSFIGRDINEIFLIR